MGGMMEQINEKIENIEITYEDYKVNPVFSYLESYFDLDQLKQDDIIF